MLIPRSAGDVKKQSLIVFVNPCLANITQLETPPPLKSMFSNINLEIFVNPEKSNRYLKRVNVYDCDGFAPYNGALKVIVLLTKLISRTYISRPIPVPVTNDPTGIVAIFVTLVSSSSSEFGLYLPFGL